MEIRKQRDALLANSKIKIGLDPAGFEQARRASVQASAASAGAIKDLNLLGSAIASKAVAPLQQYQTMLGSVMRAGQAIGPGVVSALARVSSEFQRQRDLAAFWGTSGYMHGGVNSLKASLSGLLSTGGAGFSSWLKNVSGNLAQYRTELALASAAIITMAAAAALSSKHSQNYIQATLDTRLMARRLSDKAGAEKWIESAQGTDWSSGRDSRTSIFQTVLSKNKSMGQKAAQKATEDIERYFFANQEMLQKKGIASAEQLATSISAPQLTGDDAAKYEDIFGLGFSNLSSVARLGRLSQEAKDIDINKAVEARPDEVLSKRLTATTAAMGDAVLPALNAVLGGFIKLSDIIGRIPGLGKAMGWGAVLMGAATAGLVMVSMLGSLIPGITLAYGVLGKLGLATKLAAAGQWLLNAAMTANPLGIAIVAIAGLIVVLYALEKKFGLVTKAWKLFSESSIGKGVFAAIADGKKSIEDLLGTLGKAYKAGGVGGVLKVALEGIVANSPLFKMVAFIYDMLRKLWNNSTILNKLIHYGTVIWQRMVDFFTWLLDLIKGGLQWIRDGLGVTRSEAKAKAVDIAKKNDLSWRDTGPKGEAAGWYAKTATSARRIKDDELPPGLKTATDKWLNAPKGFFEGIPGIENLRKALEDNTAALKSKVQEAVVKPVQKVTEQINPVGTGAEKKSEAALKASGIESFIGPDGNVYYTRGGTLVDDSEILQISKDAQKPEMAVGGSIIGSGSIIGHAGEQVDSAKVVLGGETTLEKINKLFSDSSTHGTSMGAGGMPTINGPLVSVQIDKVEKDVDIDRLIYRIGNEGADKLLFALRNKLDNGNTRSIGYLR